MGIRVVSTKPTLFLAEGGELLELNKNGRRKSISKKADLISLDVQLGEIL